MENHPHAEGKTCPPSVGVPKYGAGASQSVSRNVQSSPRFSVTIPQLLAALASYGVGYLYLRLLFEGWYRGPGLAVFAAVFCLWTEGFSRAERRPAPRESRLWLGVLAVLCLAACLHPTGLTFTACLLAAHGAAAYWALARTGMLAEGITGPLLPLDLLSAFVVLPFGRFFLRLRTLLAGVDQLRPRRGGLRRLGLVLLTLAVMLPVWGMAIQLLSQADVGFALLTRDLTGWAARLLPRPDAFTLVMLVLSLPVGAWLYGLVGGALRRTVPPVNGQAIRTGAEALRVAPCPAVAAALAGTCLLYVLFFAVQAGYLFGAFTGHLPAGLTAANYARQGFFELCLVCALNFALLAGAAKLSRSPLRTRPLLCGLAALLCAETFLFGLVAAAKLGLYIQRFGLTERRLFSAWAIGMLLLAAVLALARLRRAFASVRVLTLTCAVSFAAVCLFSAAALPHMNFEEYEAPMASACAPSESSEPGPLL